MNNLASAEDLDTVVSLKSAIESVREHQFSAMQIMAGRLMVGLLTLENISEMIMVNTAMDHQGPPPLTTIKPNTNLQLS